MIVSGFVASSDIVGRRVRICWDFIPEDNETLADIPPVTLRRKLRDFAFPGPAVPDPYAVYDSTTFPPAPGGGVAVTDLPSWEVNTNGLHTVYEPVSVAIAVGERNVEILRRTTATRYDPTGLAISQRVEILETGGQPGALQPSTVYYYQLFSLNLPQTGDDASPYRSQAMVTDSYGLNRVLYNSLPEVYRRHDVQSLPSMTGSSSVPELAGTFGQLRRFIDLFGISLDSIRGTAEGLRTLHDIDRVDGRFLPAIAQWIGWELSVDSEIPLRRNEIKAASRLYRLVGTVPGLRALVSQYTGWFTQVSEFAQNLALSNRPPQQNLFAVAPSADGVRWFGVNDTAEILGFGTGNQTAVGNAATAATLMSTVAESFALRPGMTLTISVDGLPPSSVRFGAQDFADITHSTAAEVAAAVQRNLPELTVKAAAGKLVVSSDTVADTSSITVVPEPASLISLDSAPTGRPSPHTDSLGRVRVFYEAWETPSIPELDVPGAVLNAANEAGNYVLRRVKYKTLVHGQWRDAHAMFAQGVTPEGDPAAVALTDGRTLAVWIDDPQNCASGLRFAFGTSRPLVPARLLGNLRGPFALKDTAVMTVTGDFGVDKFTVIAANYANLARAPALEVVTAMNAQFTKAVAFVERNGTIRIETKTGGDLARIAVDLSKSTTARVLGFSGSNAVGAPGSWDEQIDWSLPMDVVPVPQGRLAETVAINDPAGGVRMAYASWLAGKWRIETIHWDDRALVATANGLFLRSGTNPWSAVAGLPSTNVRSIAADANGFTWIVTAAGAAHRNPDGTVAALGAGLPSTDVRGATVASDGSVWFSTAAGIGIRKPDGTIATLTTANGLPSNDVRSVTVTSLGNAWIATALGPALRTASGSISVFGIASGLPSLDVRAIALGQADTLYIATGSGLASGTRMGGFAALNSDDVRAVAISPDGLTVWTATAKGVSKITGGVSTIFDASIGLASDDVRTVSLAPDGVLWVGTSAGVNTIQTDGTIASVSVTAGPNPAVQSIQMGWSAPLELASAAGSNREPHLVIDQNNRTWLVWSQLIDASDPRESWSLHYRIFDPVAQIWGADKTLTAPPVGGRASDRTPAAMKIAGGIRVFFSSDRVGGFDLWSVDITLTEVVSPLASVIQSEAANASPAPVSIGGSTWLLFRSDRNFALSQAGSLTPLASQPVPDNGTVRRFAGTVAASPDDLPRMRTRRTFGDLLTYTPNRPDGAGTLTEDELYTRGTVGLYVSRSAQGTALTQTEAARLHDFLQQFIPINLRALVIVVAPADSESVYGGGVDIQEKFADVYPFSDVMGAQADASAAAMPGVTILQTNALSSLSADVADLATLQKRTFFPPIQ